MDYRFCLSKFAEAIKIQSPISFLSQECATVSALEAWVQEIMNFCFYFFELRSRLSTAAQWPLPKNARHSYQTLLTVSQSSRFF